MYFNIVKGSINPPLMMRINADGRNDFHKAWVAAQSANSCKFNMWDDNSGIMIIANADADIIVTKDTDCEEYVVLRYKWKERDTKTAGSFKCTFTLDLNPNVIEDDTDINILNNLSGKLIVPIEEDLIVNISDFMIRK